MAKQQIKTTDPKTHLKYAKRDTGSKITISCNSPSVISAREGLSAHRRSYHNFFPTSTEWYSPAALKEIAAVEGIGRYIGLCGGGDQNLALISALLDKNRLQQVVLVDKSPYQLANFYNIAAIYNGTQTTSEWRKVMYRWDSADLPTYLRSYGEADVSGPLAMRPKINAELQIELVHANLEDYLKTQLVTDRYVIFLSNALFFYVDPAVSKSMLSAIAKNDIFKDGTVVICDGEESEKTGSRFGTALLLRKDGDNLTIKLGDNTHIINIDALPTSPSYYEDHLLAAVMREAVTKKE